MANPTPTTERRATFTEKNTRMCLAAVVGLGLIVGGAVLLLIPVLGWIMGPIFITVGIFSFFCSPILLVLPLQSLEGRWHVNPEQVPAGGVPSQTFERREHECLWARWK